jgi:hypothetical protein
MLGKPIVVMVMLSVISPVFGVFLFLLSNAR